MALQKRLDYGFNGYQVPPTPRAARSVRRRCVFKRKANDQQMCAFDLLATVAGKLLLDGESPASAHTSCGKEQPAALEDSFGKEEKDENKPLEEKSYELVCTQNDVISRPASGITTSDCSEKIGPAEQLVNDDCKLRLGIFTPSVDVESSGFRLPANCGSEDESRKQIKMETASTRNLSISNKASLCSSGHSEALDRKPSALVSPVDSLKFPFCRDNAPCGSFPGNQDNVKLVNRDDDENSSECNEPGTRNKAFKPQPRVGDRRFRKLLASKHCKITPNVKDDERYNADTERCDYLNRKNNIKRQRSMRDYPFKKRKLYDCSSVSNSEEGISSDGICTVPENGTNGGGLGPGPTLQEIWTNITFDNLTQMQQSRIQLLQQEEMRPSTPGILKLKIKSFRVPELYIEIPENATVGSLKRTVLEAVNAVLGGGLRVGVLLQGKKIRDDNKTLLQTGISQENKMDTLGFTLEPSPTPAPIRLYPEDRRGQLLCDSPQPLARYPPTPSITQNGGQQRNIDTPSDLPGTSFNNFIESDHDSAPSPPVPLRKSKRSESAQRRIRRPFTVAEVEALVQAVEKLGTGRWRDVKLRAFDSAKHRTYVDLKDKWKTLVHTARISPQQRRGEPVPQELLDRVLTAHAYWSQQQAKQQLKSQPDTSLLL
ncbi:UNVERIFIED_CONTAM: Telomere repeat-binding protein 5 [Sesamum calycinum]|uniref:Telomere repeat-binding protein 5 n=1 Tax=Sesamum calycinum TaxID=2727403 RepID=A0AAW2SEY9_9LAMI